MPAFGGIACVTVATPDLARAVELYERHLGYRAVARGPLGAELAGLWGKTGLAARETALLYPQGDGPCAFRFVASPASPGYRPFMHVGWNAAEIMVENTDAVAEHLAGKPFPVIGPPHDLSFTDKIRAMQVLGPSGEALYLTCFKEKMAEFDVPEPRHFIDSVFIMILGGPTIEAINEFYSRHLGTTPAPAIKVKITVLADAQGLPKDTPFDLAAIALRDRNFIEADAMPSGTRARPGLGPELPPAIAIVSFLVEDLDATGLRWIAPPRVIAAAPYHGRRAALTEGPVGELIELIQR